jgi:RNA polymerase sigma-70 factor (ECF subfamily)
MANDVSIKWESIKNGGIAALRELFNQTNKSLLKYSYSINHDRFLAEEVVQDVFVNLWNNRGNIEIKVSVKSYLYQSVHNLTINKIKQQKIKHNSVSMLVSEEFWQYLEETSPIDDSIIEKLEADDLENIIRKAIESLPDQCREIFILSRNYQMTNSEIAQKMNLSVSTVKTQIYRAIDKVREEFYK